jgi:signal transduction histidine kinase
MAQRPKLRRKVRPRSRSVAAKRTQELEGQLKAVRAIGSALATSVGLDAVLLEIVPNVSKLMRGARTTLFLYDAEHREIWSKIAEREERREIRLALGQGIAGWVAEHREPANVPDAYEDPRFNPSVDLETGFRTRSVLAAPLTSRDGKLLGVLQVLNHRGGPFSQEDLDLLDAIAAQTAYAVENANLAQLILDQNHELEAARQRAERRRAELDLLYQLEQETTASANLDELLDSIIVRACERLRSVAGSVLLSDRDTGRLYFRGVSGSAKDDLKKLTLEPGEGIVGWVAQHGEPLVVNRPEDDPRHDRNLARRIAVPAQALLAVPLIWDQKIIGAVEVLNPTARPGGAIAYDLEDLKVLTLIAGQVARAVALTRERQAKIDTERLAIIGRMLAGVAHDLRNPMTAISGYAQLMAMEADGNVRSERCTRILAQIDEMTAMIGDLLAFARGETQLNPTPVSVDQLAREAKDAIGAHCTPRGIALDIDAKGGTVVIDVGRTKRILYNLAKNAVDVLSKGGKLTVALEEHEGGLSMRVSDTGPGIPAEVQSRLFQPFVTSGKLNGTGLGLSIVKRFVDDHSGQIDVTSEPGVGTSFMVRLPRVALRVS